VLAVNVRPRDGQSWATALGEAAAAVEASEVLPHRSLSNLEDPVPRAPRDSLEMVLGGCLPGFVRRLGTKKHARVRIRRRGGGREYACRFEAKRRQLKKFQGLLSGSQVQNLALTVLHVPSSVDSGNNAIQLRQELISGVKWTIPGFVIAPPLSCEYGTYHTVSQILAPTFR